MMRFPVRLTLEMARFRFEAALGGRADRSGIAWIDSADLLHPGSSHPVSGEKLHSLISSRAALIWIRGSEPLDHPGIAHLVRALSSSCRSIFLETSAVLLRRRIHEFQPLPNLVLLVRFDSLSESPDASPLLPSDQTLALEGIRAAQLSGFFVAVHTVIGSAPSGPGLRALRKMIEERALDAWIITAAGPAEKCLQQAAKARELIPRAGWRRFSARVEPLLVARAGPIPASGLPAGSAPVAPECEESFNIS